MLLLLPTAEVEGVQIDIFATFGDEAPPILMPLISCANSSSGLQYKFFFSGKLNELHICICNTPEHCEAVLQYGIHGSVKEWIVQLCVLYCTERLQGGSHIKKVFGIFDLQRYNAQILALECNNAAHDNVLAHARLPLHAVDVLVQQLENAQCNSINSANGRHIALHWTLTHSSCVFS